MVLTYFSWNILASTLEWFMHSISWLLMAWWYKETGHQETWRHWPCFIAIFWGALKGWPLTHWGRDKMAAIYQTTFLNAYYWTKLWISIKISPKFVHKGPINNIPALVQIMAWGRPGDKPLSEPEMASLPTHILVCVNWPQWVKQLETLMPSEVLVSTVGADGLVQKHQAISIHITDTSHIVPILYSKRWLLRMRKHWAHKIHWRFDEKDYI